MVSPHSIKSTAHAIHDTQCCCRFTTTAMRACTSLPPILHLPHNTNRLRAGRHTSAVQVTSHTTEHLHINQTLHRHLLLHLALLPHEHPHAGVFEKCAPPQTQHSHTGWTERPQQAMQPHGCHCTHANHKHMCPWSPQNPLTPCHTHCSCCFTWHLHCVAACCRDAAAPQATLNPGAQPSHASQLLSHACHIEPPACLEAFYKAGARCWPAE
jgi:hypothetical protein